MILGLDVGNSQIYCGVFENELLKVQFRRTSTTRSSSDELGIFLRAALRENRIDPDAIDEIAACSVVPDLNYSLRACCQKYFGIEPMIMRPGIRTGLKIGYKDPKEVGADRIADAIGAVKLHPGRNLIVVDFGTATTVCAISREREFLGGNILPGLRLSMDALEANTAQLPSVEIKPVRSAIGRTTVESIQSGLYWSNVGMVKETRRPHYGGTVSGRPPGRHRHRRLFAPVRPGTSFRRGRARPHPVRSSGSPAPEPLRGGFTGHRWSWL